MDRTLYLECESGISGDMSVAMLLDLGANREVLAEALKSLPLQGYEIRISRVNRNGIDCCDFDVVLEEENHDHIRSMACTPEGRLEQLKTLKDAGLYTDEEYRQKRAEILSGK